jgi:integrase
MPSQNLTYTFVSNLKPPEEGKREEYYDTVVKGLLVRITHTGHKSFIFRYGDQGKRYTIGSFADMSIADARDKARDLKERVRQGYDPQAEKIARRNRPKDLTVNDLAIVFKNKHLPTLKKSTRDDYKRRIDNFIIPALGKMRIKDVQRHHVIEVLEDIAENGVDGTASPIQSNRVRSILSSMFNFGINRSLADHNPVQLVRPLGKEKKRKRIYDDEEIRKIWGQFDKLDEPFRSLFKMLLICGQRAGETRMMRWDEITDDLIWIIPAEKTKAGREQRLPLPEMALEVLDEIKPLTGGSDYVFESPVKRNEPIAWLQKISGEVRKESKVVDFRLHDLRRTAASYMAEMGMDRTVLGKVLNHKGLAGDDQVTAVYDRHEYIKEKRNALNLWTRLLKQILNKNESSKILKIG